MYFQHQARIELELSWKCEGSWKVAANLEKNLTAAFCNSFAWNNNNIKRNKTEHHCYAWNMHCSGKACKDGHWPDSEETVWILRPILQTWHVLWRSLRRKPILKWFFFQTLLLVPLPSKKEMPCLLVYYGKIVNPEEVFIALCSIAGDNDYSQGVQVRILGVSYHQEGHVEFSKYILLGDSCCVKYF